MRTTRSQSLRCAAWFACGTAALLLGGCASPGPPRPPSLQLPQPVRNLSAAREGDQVELRFTLPQHTTDNLPLRPPTVQATLCRGLEREPCLPIPGRQGQQLAVSAQSEAARAITWRDTLPPSLLTGNARPLLYRVQLENSRGRTAGWSDPAYTLAGAAPLTVQGLHAEATRQGLLLRWQSAPVEATPEAAGAAPTEVLLRRETIRALPPQKTKTKSANQPVWLAANAETTGATIAESLDTSAQDDIPYRYVAVRRQIVTLNDRRLEMRSTLSAPIEITLRDVFPPPVPTRLSAAAFTESGRFAIDLVWEPVEDSGLSGYNIARQPTDANGAATGASQRLNPTPVTLPAYHDATASPAQRYRYSVSAIDHKGNESAAVSVIVEPSQSSQ